MVLRLSQLILLLLAVQAASNQYQGGANTYHDPSRLQQQSDQGQGQGQGQTAQQYSYPYPNDGSQPAGPVPPRMNFGGPIPQSQVATPSNQQFGSIPPTYYRGPGTFYNPPPQQQHSGGFFARIKNSLSAAGNAISNVFESGSDEDVSAQYAAPGRPGGYSQGQLPPMPDRRFPPGGGNPPPPGTGFRGPPPGSPVAPRSPFPGYNAPPSSGDIPPGFQQPPQQQQQQGQDQSNDGLLGKVRSFLGNDERQQQPAQPQQAYRSFPPPSQQQQYPGQPRPSAGVPPQSQGNVPGASFMPPAPAHHQHHHVPPSQQQAAPQYNVPPSYSFPTGDNLQANPRDQPYNTPPPAAVDQAQHGFPPAFGQQHHQQQQQSSAPHVAPTAPVPPPVDPLAWLQQVPADPQVLIHEDSVVFIMKPKSFHRKKFEMTQAGPSALQVFTDFERVFTRFKTSDGNRALTTEELLESSGVIAPEGIADMQRAVDEMERGLLAASAASENARGDDFMNKDDFENDRDVSESVSIGSSGSSSNNNEAASYEIYEEGARQYHQALATRGNVPLAHVYPAVRARLAQLGLRDQWKDTMQMLLTRSVPLYIFSSGFGDIVTYALTSLGLSTASTTGASTIDTTASSSGSSSLPNNVRIISNFFRTAPDGTIRAFSQPTIHDRNKNITTAARHMGMPVPQRPNALVLAAHEEDVARMTDGLTNLKETLSIGYMEVTDDLPQRLPVYLNSFDAVIIGDGSFKFVSSTLEDILQTPIPSKAAAASQSSGGGLAGKLPNLGLGGLRRGIGMLLNTEPASPQTQPAVSSQYPAQPMVPGSYPSAGSQQQHQHQQQPSPQQQGQYPNMYQAQPSPYPQHPAQPPRAFTSEYDY